MHVPNMCCFVCVGQVDGPLVSLRDVTAALESLNCGELVDKLVSYFIGNGIKRTAMPLSSIAQHLLNAKVPGSVALDVEATLEDGFRAPPLSSRAAATPTVPQCA